jgi:hypothetical protein
MAISRRDLFGKSAGMLGALSVGEGATVQNVGSRNDRPNVLYVILEDTGMA